MPRTLRRWRLLKNLPATLETIRAGLPNGTPIELWWQDEARVGQKNKIARRWARRGTRPRAPHDQRTSSVYIFGALCPQEGKGAALVLPRCDTQAMSLHLAEVAQAVAPGAHGVMLMDRAGWHRATDLVVPDNLTLVLLPARAPELNPVENIWHFLRDNWLSSRVFASFLRLKGRCGPKKAAVAVAASILTTVYHMLRDGTCYQDLGPNYFARRNPARTARKLADRIRSLGYIVEIRSAA